MNYIIGNNDVGYFIAYLLGNTKLILHKTLEQLDYNAGPKVLPVSLLPLIKTEFENVEVLEFERFYDDRGKYTSIMPKNFNNLYSLYTRGKTTVENLYYDNLNKYVKFISINNNGPETSYDLFFEKVKKTVNKRIIDNQISKIDLNRSITVSDQELNYTNIISTINIVDLVELESSGKIRNSIVENYNLESFDLPYNDKFVYVCSLDSEEDKTLSKLYKQILATGKPYFRKTYIEDKIIYESMRNIYEKHIEDNKILEYVESTQISDNLRIKKVMGIDLIGKFSEWNDNTTLETIYQRSEKLKEFYNFSENNHKKVL